MVSSGMLKTVIETIAAVDNLITQGFQQPHLTITTVEEIPGLDFTITAYPNLSHGIANLKVDSDDLKGFSYQPFDHNGRVLKRGQLDNNPTLIQFNGLSAGMYLLRVISMGKTIKYSR